ncbi:S8 family peptidase [Streptomyces sp. 6N223]|uniref:S8 family peptidase n=1 Tax=Streptomyces sp. 6N223 TaxID=3457412 RepID=UPI003FD55CFD
MAVAHPLRRGRLASVVAATAATLALGGMTALPAGAAEPPEGTILFAGASNAVDGSYVVTIDASSARAASGAGESLADEYGAEITQTYSAALNGYAVEASEEEARRLAADPAVESVIQNRSFTIQGTQPNPPSWGLDRLDQSTLPLNQSYTYPDSAGEGVTAYIIDTGVRVSHSDFGGRAANGYDAIDGDNVAQDGNGHGTHVAATVAGSAHGVAKKADIVAVRVLNNQGSGTTAQVIAGIDWVTENAVKPAVANMSLGGTVDPALDEAVRNAIAAGVTFAVAAGNDGADAADTSPARVEEAITVGSTDDTDTRSYFSNYGSALDLFAPGSDITSAWHTSDSATNTISGTSMATPHVAGAAALYLADNPDATPAQVSDALTSTAIPDNLVDPGTGSPNLLLNVGEGGGGSDPPPDGPAFDNTTPVAIEDLFTVESTIEVTGVEGNAPASLGVPVDITHSWVGDLTIELIAPDGTAFPLKESGSGGSADNVKTTYGADASAVAANGTWTLRVTDGGLFDTGTLNSWGLRF